MSSTAFSADLRPDAVLRGAVLASGVALGLAGIAVLVTLPLHPAARLAAILAWLFICYRELAGLYRGFSRWRRLRMTATGDVWLLDCDQQWWPARLVQGSIVLRRVGWILLKTEGSGYCAEPIRGRCRDSDDWRRLQVIWRHVGAAP